MKGTISVDIGTQGTRTALYNQEFQPIAHSFEASNLLTPASDVVEQSPEEIFRSVTRTIKRCMDLSKVPASEVLAIVMDGQMGSIIGIQKNGKAITPVDSWLDNRCEPYIEQMRQQDESFISITGSPVTYHHGPKILWWRHEYPGIYRNINKFVQIVPYTALQLCGYGSNHAYLDFTNIAFSGFANAKNLSWSKKLCDDWHVEADKLPRIVAPWETIGHLCTEAATECGLTSEVAVFAGCGDQAACSMGAGIVEKGMSFDVSGTASVFCAMYRRLLP